MVPTPRYVLLDGDKPVSTFVVGAVGDSAKRAIFGFSDKKQYDVFRTNSQLAYKPYPLVKGYLRGQIEKADSGAAFMVLDAIAPDGGSFQVCSMPETLVAFETNAVALDSTTVLGHVDQSN